MPDPSTDPLSAAMAELAATAFTMSTIDVRGVPVRVFNAAPANVRQLFALSAGHGDKPYLVFEDERYSYGEVHALVRSLAGLLYETYGVRRGDRVAVAMRNYPEWVISYWAIVSLGAACVGLNAWWTSPEMEYGLSDSRPRVVIVDGERMERLAPILDGLRAAGPMSVIVTRASATEANVADLPADTVQWADVVSAADAPAAIPDADIDPDDDACIFYTSGTTGFPKGARLTHRGCVTNLMNIAFMAAASQAADAKVAAQTGAPGPPPAPAAPSFMAATPLFHVTANNCVLYPATLVGAKLVLMRRWDTATAIELIEREQVTNFAGVPSMGRELITHPDWSVRDTSSVIGLSGGGAPVPPDQVDKIASRVNDRAPTTGYGLTETTGIVTANYGGSYLRRPASCGRVVPTLDAKLIDENGNDLEPSSATLGELCVRGSVVVKGYLNRPEATAEAIRDGWFHTGDIARIDDDGYVYIVDRAKDMVLRGGENVYGSEVEAAIYQHDAVAEAAVFGVPDARLGEAVAVAIVLQPGRSLADGELVAFLSTRLARHKIPEHIYVLDNPLPRNASGKFLKREVRKQLTGS